MDRIELRDMELTCIIGVGDLERTDTTCLHANVKLHLDTAKACLSDNIADTVDYADVERRLVLLAEGSRFRLLEALAESLASECLRIPQVKKAEIEIEKRGILRHARAAAICISREKPKRAKRTKAQSKRKKRL